jgi:hypothetical protein
MSIEDGMYTKMALGTQTKIAEARDTSLARVELGLEVGAVLLANSLRKSNHKLSIVGAGLAFGFATLFGFKAGVQSEQLREASDLVENARHLDRAFDILESQPPPMIFDLRDLPDVPSSGLR